MKLEIFPAVFSDFFRPWTIKMGKIERLHQIIINVYIALLGLGNNFYFTYVFCEREVNLCAFTDGCLKSHTKIYDHKCYCQNACVFVICSNVHLRFASFSCCCLKGMMLKWWENVTFMSHFEEMYEFSFFVRLMRFVRYFKEKLKFLRLFDVASFIFQAWLNFQK